MLVIEQQKANKDGVVVIHNEMLKYFDKFF